MALIRQARLSLSTFLVGAFACLLPIIVGISQTTSYLWGEFQVFVVLLYAVVYNGVLVLVYMQERDTYKIAVRAGNLGVAFASGVLITFYGGSWSVFGWYFTALTFFHWSEYFTTAATNTRSLTLESFLLDHSREYQLAALASWTEFTLEWFFFPGMKQVRFLNILGLIITIGGEALRKASMFTAGRNFNHYVQHTKHQDHRLVTNGVYKLFRHPSYVGWFYWSIGTQIMLCNPCCLIGYTIVSWRFFNERIYEEEIYLLNFFGEDYLEYQRRVPTGLPFIQGYRWQV
ncbi:protein-S-isoprenylcysteine O-methyltransferase-like [Littorina saxatilis]|uniref:Protein-S-isoprenylcysteine O-methyltransferase n=1 Tax=Littorina saxatilis TaxID=31220 RepID=A0AAN9AUL9_9CAEN